MKRREIFWFVLFILLTLTCRKEDPNDPFNLLTRPLWASDSLLVNGLGAGGPGQLLYKFRGNAKFNEDGTGTFGEYTGKWRFTDLKKQIIIESDSLKLPLTTIIQELTETSLKITTAVPDTAHIGSMLNIRMTFKAK
jgi:hypothetical protein